MEAKKKPGCSLSEASIGVLGMKLLCHPTRLQDNSYIVMLT